MWLGIPDQMKADCIFMTQLVIASQLELKVEEEKLLRLSQLWGMVINMSEHRVLPPTVWWKTPPVDQPQAGGSPHIILFIAVSAQSFLMGCNSGLDTVKTDPWFFFHVTQKKKENENSIPAQDFYICQSEAVLNLELEHIHSLTPLTTPNVVLLWLHS